MAATLRVTEEVKQATDGRMLRLPAILSRPVLITLRKRYEDEAGRTNDSVYPCAAMIEARLEEIEEGTCVAQPLSEVISIDQSNEEDYLFKEIGTNIKVRKAPKAIAMPTSTEEIRQRFRTLAISYVLASYKHGSRLWVKTATMANFTWYVEHLLSDQVANLVMCRDDLSVRPDWTTVLGYDLAMRKHAARAVLYEGLDWYAAIKAATLDLSLKERYFTTPTAVFNAMKRSGASTVSPGQALPGAPGAVIKGISNKQKKKEARAKAQAEKEKKEQATAGAPAKTPKGKGKGGGKSGGKDRKPIRKTPDGLPICTFYGETTGCSKDTCTFLHVCWKCFGNHPGHGCNLP
jgi:hypothetical protein